jgi:hypothetical protein
MILTVNTFCHSDNYEDYCLLNCDVTQSGRQLSTHHRNLLPLGDSSFLQGTSTRIHGITFWKTLSSVEMMTRNVAATLISELILPAPEHSPLLSHPLSPELAVLADVVF